MRKHTYLFGLAAMVSTAGLIYTSATSASIYATGTPAESLVAAVDEMPAPVSDDVLEDQTSEVSPPTHEPEAEAYEEIESEKYDTLLEDEENKAEAEVDPAPAPDQEAGPVATVPFYSQFTDISSARWQKVGCGIASLAMLIEYYEPGTMSVDSLLQQGIDAGAYLEDAGWTYAGLIGLAHRYGLSGETHDLGGTPMSNAFAQLEAALHSGPVMVSVHYTFDPKNPIPHLVVANGIHDGKLYYNDPAEKQGGGSISIAQFQSAWKQRYIEFRG